MKRWYENVILAGAIVSLAPTLLLIPVYGPFALLFSPIGLIMLVIYWRVRRARLHPTPIDPTPRRDVRPPIPPVDDEAIAAIPEPVTACPDCAFLGVRMPGIRDGLWPGGGELGDRIVCPRCGYQGLAVRFEKREDYGQFLRDLATPPPNAETAGS